jgi:hypothetical protein
MSSIADDTNSATGASSSGNIASGPVLAGHKHVFGFKQLGRNNVFFGNDNQVIWPAGNAVVVYHQDTKSQQFLVGKNGDAEVLFGSLTAFCVSENKK